VKILLAWSSGKDSAYALHLLRQQSELEVAGLVTTLDAAAGRVAMHSVREMLLDAQADVAGLPLWKVPLPWPCSNARYEEALGAALASAKAQGIRGVAFGDLFLEDIRAWREAQMARAGLTPLFPLWGRPTRALAEEMIASGLRAVVVCVDCKQLPARFAGRAFDRSFLADLPPETDACGERGEFHTFSWAGPMLRAPIPVRVGELTEVDGFAYADLQPA
jgi:uncharacterized protein (TIGR00290 family)